MTSLLADKWILWFHDLQSTDWSINGYEKIGEFNSIEEFWVLYNNIDLTIGMFFLMRANHLPIWDDPSNINGGSFTNRYTINDSQYHFTMISALLIGENLNPYISGVSLSPKTKNAIIRIWFSKKISNNDIINNKYIQNIEGYKIINNEWKMSDNK